MIRKNDKKVKFSFFLFILFCFLTEISAQDIMGDIVKSLRTGDAELLSTHFDSRIKLSILNREYDPSQSQAKEIMREFFRGNVPESFEVKFESEKKDSRFIIGVLKTKTGNYRVNVFFKKLDQKDLIHLLRIEEEDESTF